MINYLTLHNPTASQVRVLGRSRLDPDKIAVVVGGDSVLYGGGPYAEEWTGRLQERLGDRYQVINFGLCGAETQEFGATAAEMLARDHPRLILITDSPAGPVRTGDPDGRPVLRYFFWEAHDRGWLTDDPDREARLRELRRAKDPAFRELSAGIQLDRALAFRDLWTTLEYRSFSTTWTPLVGAAWCKARKDYPDPSAAPPPRADEGQLQSANGAFVEVVRAGAACYRLAAAGGGPDLAANRPFSDLAHSLRCCFPEHCRNRTLVVINHLSPYDIDQVNAEDRAGYFAASTLQAETFRRAGMTAVEFGNELPPALYRDHVHFTMEGGRRMAEAVAPLVRELARRQGYTEAGEE
jgi:hypothetical protein